VREGRRLTLRCRGVNRQVMDCISRVPPGRPAVRVTLWLPTVGNHALRLLAGGAPWRPDCDGARWVSTGCLRTE